MIECLPRSLCSWEFIANGMSAGVATLEYDWFTEQGRITGPQMTHEIRKHGVASGHWTMERGGRVVSDAKKHSAMHQIRTVSFSVFLK